MFVDRRFGRALSIAGFVIFGFVAVANVVAASDPSRLDPAPLAMIWMAAVSCGRSSRHEARKPG